MSEDRFWEQWGSGPGGEKPAEPEKPAPEPSRSPEDEPDALTAWLKAIPPNETILAASPPAAQGPVATPAELAELWPPAAPVDPFSGMGSPGAGTGSDWDLAFDEIAPDAPATAPEVAPPPTAASPVPSPASAPPGATASPAPDFVLDLGELAPPAPVAHPFGMPDPAVALAGAPAAPVEPMPVSSPFGPPPPPVEPPEEALQAPPLRLEIITGRRTVEQTVQGEALIGRPDVTRRIHPEIDLRLDDAVSRRHAKIFVRNGRYVLTDLNSTNGTRYNQQWLQPEVEVALTPGDEIEVGEATLIRVLEAPATDA